jgi:phenylpropionate dioxygenase-like ring-hydroxylating dioxygenase large terminal subunit
LQGKLTGVPDEDQFFDLKKSEHSLPPISVATWEGFIFINLDPNPKESLVEYLGVRGEELQGYPFNKLLSCHSWHAEIKCNWKMAVDAFQEAYHVSFVHKHSISDAFKVQGNSLAHPLTLKLYNHHHMLSLGSDPQSVYGNPLLKYEEKTEAVGTPQKKPIEAAALRFAASSTGGTEFSIDRLPAGVNPTKNPNWNGDITVFFPNLFTFMRVNYYQAYNFWPLAVDRTRFEGRVYYAQAENAGERFYEEYRKIMLRDVLLEDWSTVERSQAVMASGVRTHMVLQDNEILLRNFRRVLESYGGKDYTGNGISLCDEGGLSHVR